MAELVFIWIAHGWTPTGQQFVLDAVQELLNQEAELRR
jgi:hypothetical protein